MNNEFKEPDDRERKRRLLLKRNLHRLSVHKKHLDVINLLAIDVAIALDSLSKESAELLRLRYIEGWTVLSMAKSHRMGRDKMRAMIKTAKNEFRTLFSGLGDIT